jgi:hypothetical protein
MRSEFDLAKIEFIDSVMKNESKCEAFNPNDLLVREALLQEKGRLINELNSPKCRAIVKVRWNKERLYFSCSIAFLEKQKDGKSPCIMRFDDNHNCRHLDADLHGGKTKIFHKKFVYAKIECPLFHHIINSLPKAKADEWKINLSKEILLAKQKHKEYRKNPNKIHFYNK